MKFNEKIVAVMITAASWYSANITSGDEVSHYLSLHHQKQGYAKTAEYSERRLEKEWRCLLFPARKKTYELYITHPERFEKP